MEVNFLGKFLIITGAILVIFGLGLMLFSRIPFSGRLPGDILIKKENFTFYFPLTTSIILSLIISVALFLFRNK